jgi:hypothetical protein
MGLPYKILTTNYFPYAFPYFSLISFLTYLAGPQSPGQPLLYLQSLSTNSPPFAERGKGLR